MKKFSQTFSEQIMRKIIKLAIVRFINLSVFVKNVNIISYAGRRIMN